MVSNFIPRNKELSSQKDSEKSISYLKKKINEKNIKKNEPKYSVSGDYFQKILLQHDVFVNMKPKKMLKGIIAKDLFIPQNQSSIKKKIKKNKCVIRGGSTSFTASVLPHSDDIIIDTMSLNNLSVKKQIATVGGGVPFYQLMNEAKKHELEVPCYPLTYNSATIGGFISNNGMVGVNSRGAGYLYDYIEEMDVVTSSGTIFKVRGDDILDFFGAEGTLGVITKIKLRLLEKQTHYAHMYGFDGAEDVLKFLESDDDIYVAYFINDFALKNFEREWRLKYIPKYTLLVVDKNWKDDYAKEVRTDLSKRGISHIFPKDILTLSFKKLPKLELSITKNTKKPFVGDAFSRIEHCVRIFSVANKYQIPVFGSFGKNEVLYRFYFNANGLFKKQKYFNIMHELLNKSEPYSAGSYFRKYLKNTKREKRQKETLGKYDTRTNVLPRAQLYNHSFVKKLLSPIVNMLGGKMWKY